VFSRFIRPLEYCGIAVMAALTLVSLSAFMQASQASAKDRPHGISGLGRASCKVISVSSSYSTTGLIYDQSTNLFRGNLDLTTTVVLTEYGVPLHYSCRSTKAARYNLTRTRFPAIFSSGQLTVPAQPCSDGQPRAADGNCIVQASPQVIAVGPDCYMPLVDQAHVTCPTPNPPVVTNGPPIATCTVVNAVVRKSRLRLLKYGGLGPESGCYANNGSDTAGGVG
jgi:hypothetical protein